MSGSFESVRWNAFVQTRPRRIQPSERGRGFLGFFFFWGGGGRWVESELMLTARANPLY